MKLLVHPAESIMSFSNPTWRCGKSGGLAYFQNVFIQNIPSVIQYRTGGMLPSSGATGKKHFPDSLSCPQAVICTAWPTPLQVAARALREKLGR